MRRKKKTENNQQIDFYRKTSKTSTNWTPDFFSNFSWDFLYFLRSGKKKSKWRKKNATRGNVQYLYRPISPTGLFRTFDSITCSLMLFRLRKTRFRASSSRKSLPRGQLKRNEGGREAGGGRRTRLPANSTILKKLRLPTNATSYCCKGLLRHCERSIHQSDQVSFLLFVLCNNSIGKLTGSIQSYVIRELSRISLDEAADEEPQGELEAEFKFLIRYCNSQALLFFSLHCQSAP